MVPTPVKVLVVEDNPADADLLAEFLADAQNWNLTCVESLQQAVVQAQQQTFDVILLDLSLPDSFGLETISRLQTAQIKLPIVVLTGLDDEAAGLEALRRGAQDYLIKGELTEPLLERVIRYSIERWQLQTMMQEQSAAIAASEARLQGIMQSAPGFIVTFDREGTITYINRTVAGLTVEDLAGETITALTPPCYWELQNEMQRQVFEGETVQYELEAYVDQTRTTAWFQINASPIWEDGQITTAIATAIDISDRKRAEEALRESERRYAALTEAAPVAIFRLDASGQCVYVNDRWSEMTGRPTESALGSHWMQALHPDDRDRILAAVARAIQHEQTKNNEGRHLHPDGTITWFYSQMVPERDDNDNLIGYVGTLTDITNLKQTEELLQLTNKQLERANLELARATRLKDEFLANMSHELRTPLTSILGMSEILIEQIFGPLNEKQYQYAEVIAQSGKHLLSLINDILDLAKIESGKLELQISSSSITTLCNSSMNFVKQLASQKNIRLHSSIANDITDVTIDELRIRQALINLLSNAIKFTPAKGMVHLSVTRRPIPRPLARSEAEFTGFWIEFSVTDTGIGIAPDDFSKLFQPFVQIDSDLNRQYSGTGLGLALVRQIAELHGGTVTVSSEVGQGSCFTLQIPERLPQQSITVDAVLPTPSTLDTVALESQAEALTPLILLAEDNLANVETVSAYIKRAGYQLLLAANGQEAIALTQQHHPDLILMDIQMPGVDGLTAIQHIRADSAFRSVPIIALTALAMPGDREKCLKAGATEYLTKPVSLKLLVAKIQQLLEQ